MKEVSVFDAKTHFSGLVDQVYMQHESITITRRGIKIAKIVPIESEREQNIENVIRELQALGNEIGRVGVTMKDIQKWKEEGRK